MNRFLLTLMFLSYILGGSAYCYEYRQQQYISADLNKALSVVSKVPLILAEPIIQEEESILSISAKFIGHFKTSAYDLSIQSTGKSSTHPHIS